MLLLLTSMIRSPVTFIRTRQVPLRRGRRHPVAIVVVMLLRSLVLLHLAVAENAKGKVGSAYASEYQYEGEDLHGTD